MFNRNEKYGQALHLQYGFDGNTSCRTTTSNTGFLKKLKSVFSLSNASNEIETLNNSVEVALDKTTIEQAIQAELRNTDAAANENQLDIFKGKIA